MIKIFVVCHKPAYIPDNELLVPVQVGAALAEKRIPQMEPDDNGENISRKNPWYCELTAQYWAWKNVEVDYYGFFHYRRYLAFHRVCPVQREGKFEGKHKGPLYYELEDIRDDLKGYGVEETAIDAVVQKYDLITVLRERINTTVYRQYAQYHDSKPLEAVVRILEEKYPEYKEAADEYLGSKEIYYMNMFIMKKPMFMEYAAWLFDILGTYEKSNEFQMLGDAKKRLMGYLGERLFGIFYTYQRRQGALCAEVPYLKFYNTEIEKKAGADKGISGNVRKFRLKPTKIEVEIDMRKFNKMFPAGSWRRILVRSIFLR